jgi:hypothetical protein
MKKVALIGCTVIAVATMVFGLSARSAQSRPLYLAEFIAKYTKPDSNDADDKAYLELVKDKTKCQVCHEPGMNRKLRNQFGKELAKLFDPPNQRDKKKVDEALDKVMEVHIDDKDPKSSTYGELVKNHKLPAGEPKPEEKK